MIHEHTVDYRSPIGHCEQDGDMINFVDDRTVLYSHTNPTVISQVLSSHYDRIEKYIHSNKMVINADKSHLLVCGTRKTAVRREEVSLVTWLCHQAVRV